MVALIAALLAVIGWVVYAEWDRLGLPPLSDLINVRRVVPTPLASSTITVRPGESIDAAMRQASAGMEISVEPGEYRERIQLKTGVRVVSSVPQGASLRLPGGASETDPAVVAFDVSDAELSGFHIVGDAATPLGTGVVVRNSDVTLNDVEISGAKTAAVEYIGAKGGSIMAGYFHDNPGSAIVVRSGASPRIAHNAFIRNATSERAPGMLVVDPGAHPKITQNTFYNVAPSEFSTLARDNWFIPPADNPPSRRDGRGRR